MFSKYELPDLIELIACTLKLLCIDIHREQLAE